METDFTTTHNLELGLLEPVEDFIEMILAGYERDGIPHDAKAIRSMVGMTYPFRLGTIGGTFQVWREAYSLIAVQNYKPGNGHLEDLFEMFDYLCRRDNKDLIVAAVQNERFRQHLLTKRGFVELDNKHRNVIKFYSTIKHRYKYDLSQT